MQDVSWIQLTQDTVQGGLMCTMS